MTNNRGITLRVLIVEDNEQIRRSIVRALRASSYAVDETGDGREGLWYAQEYDYDIAILDILLPSMDGRDVLKKLRASGKDTPVLFLSALDSIEAKVEGLRLGADDYLVKSFAIEELLARVEALTRRGYRCSQSVLKIDDIELDRKARVVRRAGTLLKLSPQSFALLELLLLRKGEVISRSLIEEKIYDEHAAPMSNVVETAIYTLRKALTMKKDCKPIIHTRRGMGYILESIE